MSRLVALIDEYHDAHGHPGDASVARAVGIAPQTISSWRRRGMKRLPKQASLRKLAAFLGKSEAEVFYAAGVDTGYIIEEVQAPDDPARTA